MKPFILLLAGLFFTRFSFAATVDTVTIYSNSMHKNIRCVVITPSSYGRNSKPYPVVYLLHGHSGDYSDWVKKAPALLPAVDEMNVLVVCPDGNYNSWYFDSPIDTGYKYETHVALEVPHYIDAHYRTIASRKGRAITGLSMGGHGALYLGIRHKDVFGAAGSMSGGVDFRPFPKNWQIDQRLGDYATHQQTWDDNTVMHAVDQLQNGELAIAFECGVDDFFIQVNRNLHQKLVEKKIAHDYTERPGGHSWPYWSNAIQYQLLFFRNYFGKDSAPAQTLSYLYSNGEAGYSCFRIPSLLTTGKGNLLAFAEARKNGCGDTGDIDLVLKRSKDGGKTWSALQVVWSDSTNTCGNPVPIFDKQTGRIVLLATWNLGSDHEKDIIHQTSKDTRRVFVLSSADEGASWSAPREITQQVKQANWTWYATGPCAGIQLQQGKYKGRLVAPCNHLEAVTKKNYSHIIYSDDHGKSWKLGGSTPQDGVNESTVAELGNGSLLLNMRNTTHAGCRQVATSRDGGASWLAVQPDTALKEPMCQGSLIRYAAKGHQPALVFANPADAHERKALTLRASEDDGASWPQQYLLYPGPAAYSALSVKPDGNIACLYEAGYQKPYEGIVYETVAAKELLHAAQ